MSRVRMAPEGGSTTDLSAPAIAVTNLTVQFPDPQIGWTSAAEQVSFEIKPGRTLGLVGESGSGKTATSLAAMGLIGHLGGRAAIGSSIRVGQLEIVGASKRELRRVRGRHIGMIFQDPMASLNPSFRVGKQLAETYRYAWGGTRSNAMSKSIEMLRDVGIPDPRARARAYPHELSGGMCQRVMIALALILRPSVLIADEPTTALDVTVQAQILALLKRIQSESRMAVLYITHDLNVAVEVCDEICVMKNGRIVERGVAHELYRSPKHSYSQELIAAAGWAAREGARLDLQPDRE